MTERRRLLLQSLVLTLTLVAACYFFAIPYYRDGDQDGIRSVLEGLFSPVTGPQPYMVWQNVLLGYPLAALYRLAPGGYWYDGLMLLCMATAIAILIHAMLRQKLMPFVLIPSLGLAMLMAAFGIIGVSFSQVSIMLGFGGVIALLEQCRFPSRSGLLLGVGCLFVSSLVRFEVSQFFLPILLAAALPLGWAMQPTRQTCKRLAMALGLTILAMLAACYWHRHLALDWVADFWHYNHLRNQVMDFVNPEIINDKQRMRGVFAQAGWTAQQYKIMSYWWLYNSNLFNAETFQRLVDAGTRSGLNLLGGKPDLPIGYDTRRFMIFFLCLPLIARTAPRSIYLCGLMLLYVTVHAATGMLLKPMPPYINSGFVFCLVGFAAYSATIWERADAPAAPMKLPLIVMVLPLYFLSPILHAERQQFTRYEESARQAHKEIREFTQLPNVDVMVTLGLSYPYSQPFHPLAVKGTWKQINGATFASLPYTTAALKAYGLEGDVERHICERPGTVIETNLGLGAAIPHMQRFIHQRYGLNVRMERLYHGEVHDIFRCTVMHP